MNDAAKRTLDKARPSGENSSSSSPSSNQYGHAPGPTPLVVPPSCASQDKVPGAVPLNLFAPVDVAQPASGSGATTQLATASEGGIEGSNPSGSAIFATPEAKETPRIQSEVSSARETVADTPPTSAKGGVRDTSMAAYRALQWSGKLAAQQMVVLALFLANPTARRTRQEIASYTGLSINAVCGRVNELMSGPFFVLVEDDEKKTCAITKNRVTALRLARVDEVHVKEEETI